MPIENRARKSLFKWAFRYGLAYVFFVALFTLARVAYVLAYRTASDAPAVRQEWGRLFYTGFLYDSVVVLFGLLPWFVAVALGLFVKRFYRVPMWMPKRWARGYLRFLFVLFAALLIGDFFFYKFFQSHFNLLAFGIVDDDTKAVLDSVWSDYPVIRILLGFALALWLASWVIRRIMAVKLRARVPSHILYYVLTLLLIGVNVLGLRGSVGTFPLEKDDAIISENAFVNSMTMNGVFALKDAFADRAEFAISVDTAKTFEAMGFGSLPEAVQAYLNLPTRPKTHAAALAALVDTTAVNPALAAAPPHVVFIQMESMSNYYLSLHSGTFNLLGELENQLPHCYLFRDFTSYDVGTIHSLEGLMVNSPLTPLCQSQYLDKPFSTSSALPYREAGYRTHFITGAKLGWRNLDKFVQHQYYQNLEGNVAIEKAVPKAQKTEWGVFDEYLFDRIAQVIEQGKGPQFVFAMTTTNHTPYDLPTTYTPLPLTMPAEVTARLRCDPTIAHNNFRNYQYANHFLGMLIKRVRESPWGRNVIIAASGDHNTLQTFDYETAREYQKRGVPLVLYVPEHLRPRHPPVPGPASHRDIFPTLYGLSLSGRPYFRLGSNLFDSTRSVGRYSVNCYDWGFSEAGAVSVEKPKLVYGWKGGFAPSSTQWPGNQKAFGQTLQVVKPNPALKALRRRIVGYQAVSAYLIQRSCAGAPVYAGGAPVLP